MYLFSTKLTAVDKALMAFLEHIAQLFEYHDSNISSYAIAELKAAINGPVIKLPNAQCIELDGLLVKPSSPTMFILAEA